MWREVSRRSFAGMTDRRIALLMGLVAAIGVVLVAGALALLRTGDRRVAVGALGFAIAGFLVGLRFTIDDGGVQLAYHVAVLPVLVVGLALAIRPARTGGGGRAGFRPGR